jgi:hypothetical protein
MLLLTSITDKVQVITSAAGQIDVHASWIDYNPSGSPQVQAGRLNTRISTAATSDVVGSPAASTARNVKAVKIGNNHASVSNVVTLQHTDGTNVIILEQATLAPGERMSYEEGYGIRVFDAAGREKVAGVGQPWGNANTADAVANAAATYLAGSGIQIGGRVQPGSFFKWRLRATKTAAGVAVPTIAVYTGPNASTADTSRVSHSGAAQTAVADTGAFEVDAIVRAVGAAATVIESFVRMDHTSADGAGMGTFRYLSALSSAFTLGASDYIGLVVNPGSAGVWTFQHVLVDAGNLIS